VRRRTPPSLLLRIALRLSAITLAAIVLSYGWLLYELQYSSDRLVEGSLIAQATEIARSIRLSEGQLSVHLRKDFRADKPEHDGRFRYAVTDASGVVLFGSQWLPAPRDTVVLFDPRHNLYQTRHNSPAALPFFGAIVDTVVDGHHFTVSVERNSRHLETLIDTLLEEFFIHGAWIFLGLLSSLFIMTLLTIRSVIRPVEQLSREAAAIGPRARQQRLSESGIPREILGLVQAVNSALDRLDQAYQAQREFTAAAAHELRTPLAILRAHIDTLADSFATGELKSDVDAMARIVAQLLRVARVDAIVLDPGDSCDLSAAAIDVAAQLIPPALHHGKQIEVSGADRPVHVAAGADLVAHALRNLVENAIAHAGDAPSIEIVVEEGGALRVVDHGPGIPFDQRERVFQRFWRGQRTGDGVGLGLYIVKRISEMVGGRVEIGDTPGGGATFTLTFRLAPTAAAPPVPYREAAE
jgi:signal transduction histidine kinase